jgi:hypothetical protein
MIMIYGVHAASSGSTNAIELVAWIGIPVFLALCGAIFGIVKSAIRFAQYMAHSEQSADATASSSAEINQKLTRFIDRTDVHLNIHDREIAILKFAASVEDDSKRRRIVTDLLKGEDDGVQKD